MEALNWHDTEARRKIVNEQLSTLSFWCKHEPCAICAYAQPRYPLSKVQIAPIVVQRQPSVWYEPVKTQSDYWNLTKGCRDQGVTLMVVLPFSLWSYFENAFATKQREHRLARLHRVY